MPNKAKSFLILCVGQWILKPGISIIFLTFSVPTLGTPIYLSKSLTINIPKLSKQLLLSH